MDIHRYVQLQELRRFTSIAAGAFMLMAPGAAGAITIPLQSYGTGVPADGNAWTLNASLGGTLVDPLARFTFIKVASDSTQGEFGLSQILFEAGLGSILGSFFDFSFSGGVEFSQSIHTNGALPREPALVPSNPWGDDIYVNDLDDNFARFVASSFGESLKDFEDAVTIRYRYSGTLDDLLSALLDFNGNSRIAVRVEGARTACAAGACGLAAAPLAPVPLPAAAWLLLSALIGLGVSARRKIR